MTLLNTENEAIEEPIEEEIITQEEYEGSSESESNYSEIPEQREQEESKDYVFKTLKDFDNRQNTQLINDIQSNSKYLTNIVELLIDAVEDDLFIDAAKTIFPNVEPITKPLDREIIHKMIMMSDKSILSHYGYAYLSTWLEESRHLGLIFNTKKDEIVGSYQVIHRNNLAVDIVIYLRGCFKQRAKTAKEMVIYWGSRYARKIWEQGYKYALASTLTKRHAALVEHVRNKECKILLEKLKIEKQDRSIEELKEESKKLVPGFKNTGTVLPRIYQGSLCWETSWRYDLAKKFKKED